MEKKLANSHYLFNVFLIFMYFQGTIFVRANFPFREVNFESLPTLFQTESTMIVQKDNMEIFPLIDKN